MNRTVNVVVALMIGCTAAVAAERLGEPVTCLKGLDPVALTQGQELPGDNGISAVRGRYRYLFAKVENKATFEKQPNRYAIQLGGGCGRMGPLSGVGSPDRFLVHEGRIYIFASDQCLNGFKSAPEKHIETDDPPPKGSEADLQRGQELIQRALVGFGGAAKVDAITSLEFKRVRAYQADGENKEHATYSRVVFPDRYRLDDVWHSGSSADFVRGDVGYRIESDQAWPMDEIVRREFIKTFRRNPLVLLKARKESEFSAFAAGRGKVGDRDVEWLVIGLDGATNTLGIDATTGRVLSIRSRGRAPAAIGEVTRTFSDFRDVDGVILPFASTVTYNDSPAVTLRPFASVAVNPILDAKLFAAPE